MMKGIAFLELKDSTSMFTFLRAAMLLGLVKHMSTMFSKLFYRGFCSCKRKIAMTIVAASHLRWCTMMSSNKAQDGYS